MFWWLSGAVSTHAEVMKVSAGQVCLKKVIESRMLPLLGGGSLCVENVDLNAFLDETWLKYKRPFNILFPLGFLVLFHGGILWIQTCRGKRASKAFSNGSPEKAQGEWLDG